MNSFLTKQKVLKYIKYLLLIIITPLKILINYILKRMNYFIIYRIGSSIGDQVCLTGYINLLSAQKNFKIIVLSNFPQLFINNPKIYKVIDTNTFSKVKYKIINSFLFLLRGGQIENFVFKGSSSAMVKYMRESKSEEHLIELHSKHFKINLDYNVFKNEIFLTSKETKVFKNKFNLPKKFALIHSQGKISFTPNKEWDLYKLQSIVNGFNDITWIQIGVSSDIKLENTIDLRGKSNLRELAYIISKAEFILSTEGLYNHIASAYDVLSFVIYTGFSKTQLAQYKNTIAITNQENVECSPCWLLDNCKEKDFICSKGLSSDKIYKIIKNKINT